MKLTEDSETQTVYCLSELLRKRKICFQEQVLQSANYFSAHFLTMNHCPVTEREQTPSQKLHGGFDFRLVSDVLIFHLLAVHLKYKSQLSI